MAFREPTMKRRRARAAIVLLLGAIVCMPWFTGRATGQPEDGEDAEAPRNFELSEDGLNNSMLLNEADVESSEVVGHLHSALGCQERGEWAEALKEYYEVINSPQDFLYSRSGLDENRVYIGLKEFCRQQLESFPEGGKLAFKTLYEPAVKAMYEQARRDLDMDTLKLIHFNYSLSPYSGDALMLMAGVLFESGDVTEAFSYYNRLITRNREMHQSLAVAYGRLATCAVKIGPSVLPIMRERGKELEGDLGNQPLVTADEKGRHVETPLKQLFANAIAKIEGMADASAPAAAEQNLDAAVFERLELKWKKNATIAFAATCNAALYGNKLFVDPMGALSGIGEYDARSGKTINVLGSTQSRKQAFTSKMLPGEELMPATVSEDADNFYAVIPYSLAAAQVPGFSLVERWGTRLMAYGKRTNKILWYWTDPQEQYVPGVPLSTIEDRQFMGEVYLTSAPARSGAYLYAGAVRVARPATLQYYIVCFDAATGVMKWRTFIGENAPQAVEMPGGGSGFMPAPGSGVCVANDTVFFSSNMGAVGAVNAVTGDVKWAAKYHKPPAFALPNGVNVYDPAFLWHASAPLYLPNIARKGGNGVVVMAPRDSDHLYAFDPETGKRIWDKTFRPNDNVPVEPNEPPRILARFGDREQYVIFQGALTESQKVRAEQAMMQLKQMGQNAPPQPGGGAPQAARLNTQIVDLATGDDSPFDAYLGAYARVVGGPIIIGPVIFLMTEITDKSQTTYRILRYDTSKNDRIMPLWTIGDECENRKIYRMFIAGDLIIFVCDGTIYAYGPRAANS